MKTIKLTKRTLRLHPADLLIKLGAVDLEKKRAYPSHVYFSKEDYKELRVNLRKNAKKQYPGFRSRYIDSAVGMELLNYGPNQNLEEAIRPGYVLVDFDSIELEKKGESV